MNKLASSIAGVLLALLIAALALYAGERAAVTRASGFAGQVDLSPLDRSAVHLDGRLYSFDSFARLTMGDISGGRRIVEQPHDFTYLDLMIRPERYAEADVIFLKNKQMREQILAALEERPDLPQERRERIMRSGLISENLLDEQRVQSLLQTWSSDLIKTAKFVGMIQYARHVKQSEMLSDTLRIVPPASGDPTSPWLNVNDLFPTTATSPGAEALPGEIRAGLRSNWAAFVRAWRAENAPDANAALASFCELLPRVNPALYPDGERLAAEAMYFKHKHFTWIWCVYLVSVIFLLMSVVYRWDWARGVGMGAFSAAFVMHTAALGLRWYVAGRWPNSNMFEAVTTAVWFGACLAVVLEVFGRRTPMRNMFALCGATASMAALMAAHYIPQLDASIRNMMPVLHDLWLYIHTNVIICSYALIAMAAVTAGIYLVRRLFGAPADYAKAGGAATLIDSPMRASIEPYPRSETLAVAAAGAVPARPASRGPSLGEVLDGATMVLMELSFVMLWAGIIMGAIWADHSWGRPWGWDPKEVFALNTFIVFLVLVHVRLKVKDKGLWTALLAVIGCGVMLFNWIVINFVIAGLHSYA